MFKTSPASRIATLLAVGALAAAPLAARAQVYKCPHAGGSVAYQSTPCPTDARPAPHPTAAQLNAQRAALPRDDKPYDDPYRNSVNLRPFADAPLASGMPSRPGGPATRGPGPAATSGLAADVQARNRLENKQAAFNESHPSPQRIANCQTARSNVSVLDQQRPVYSSDDKGSRTDVDDKDRPAAIATAQQQVGDNCR